MTAKGAYSPPVTELALNADAPAVVSELLPESLNGRGYIVYLSPTCASCRTVADELGRRGFEHPIAVVIGGAQRLTGVISGLLPPGTRYVSGDEAESVASVLGLSSTPFTVEIYKGRITGWSVVNTLDDFGVLTSADPGASLSVASDIPVN